MKVFFAPYVAANPYQKEIEKRLNTYHINVFKPEQGTKDFFKTKQIFKADIIHFHWFDTYILTGDFYKSLFKVIYFLYNLKKLKKNNVKFVWTVHNLHNHENLHLKLERFFMRKFVTMTDAFAVHNEFSKKMLQKKFTVENSKIYKIPHGNYINSYPKADIKLVNQLKQEIGLISNKTTFMILGHIRPYKGVLDAIAIFKEQTNNTQLLICGKVKYKDDEALIKKEIKGFSNIKFVSKFIEDNQLTSYIALADVMIYSYKDILTSGALLLGMSFKKVCLASKVGSLAEYLDAKYLFENLEDLHEKIKAVSKYSKEELNSVGEHNFKRIQQDTWSLAGDLTKKMYQSILK